METNPGLVFSWAVAKRKHGRAWLGGEPGRICSTRRERRVQRCKRMEVVTGGKVGPSLFITYP